MNPRWTRDEERQLMLLWPHYEIADIAVELGRSSQNIRDHVCYMRRRSPETSARLAPKKRGPKKGLAEVEANPAPERYTPRADMRVIDDGYPDVPWHMRISHRDQRVGVTR